MEYQNYSGEKSGTVGRTQEKVDMKQRPRADVNRQYGGARNETEENGLATPTLRGGFISDGDVFGTGEDKGVNKGAENTEKALNNEPVITETGVTGAENGLTIDKNGTVTAKHGKKTQISDCGCDKTGKSSSSDRESAQNVLGDSDFSDYGDFEPSVSSAEWHTLSQGVDDGDGTAEEEDESKTSAPQNRENDEKHDKAVVTKSGEKLIKTIVIAGQIEGHSQLPQGQKATRYEELIPQLVEIEESEEIGGLLIILNTVGGDVEAGLALSELIVGMKKPTASLVLGGGHSIGVPLAVSTNRSFIVPSATMTLHPVRITGMILGAPQTYVYLNKMQERITRFTCNHCNMSPKRFNELMLSRDEMSTDLGSVLDGHQAVEEGLIDSLGSLSDAIEFLKGTIK